MRTDIVHWMMNAWIMRWSPRFPTWSPSEEDLALHEAAIAAVNR